MASPSIGAIFMSGFAELHELDPNIPVVEKPFAFPDLARRVRAVLDEARRVARVKEKPQLKKSA